MIATSKIIIGEREFNCRLVIFDMDGTLVDERARFRSLAMSRAQAMTELAGKEAVRIWSRASGVELSTGRIDMHGPLARAPRRDDLVVAATALYLGGRRWRDARRLAEQIYEAADKIRDAEIDPILHTGVEATLSRMRRTGLKLAIATNEGRAAAENTMRAQSVYDLFDAFVGADEVESPKPAPDMILLACERCGITPSEAVYIGDQPEDMNAGRAAKVNGLLAVRSEYADEAEMTALADALIDSVEDIIVI